MAAPAQSPTHLASRLACLPTRLASLFRGDGLALAVWQAHLPRTLHNLYLRLLTNSDFKHAFAERYAANYTQLAAQFCHPSQKLDEALFSSQISVRSPPPCSTPLLRSRGFSAPTDCARRLAAACRAT